jgi:hypothetical protein
VEEEREPLTPSTWLLSYLPVARPSVGPVCRFGHARRRRPSYGNYWQSLVYKAFLKPPARYLFVLALLLVKVASYNLINRPEHLFRR